LLHVSGKESERGVHGSCLNSASFVVGISIHRTWFRKESAASQRKSSEKGKVRVSKRDHILENT